MKDKNKAKLHSIALNHNVRDEVARLIVECPILFMRETIEGLDTDDLDKFNFYHKHFGRFYLKEQVLKHIKKHKKDGK